MSALKYVGNQTYRKLHNIFKIPLEMQLWQQLKKGRSTYKEHNLLKIGLESILLDDIGGWIEACTQHEIETLT
jgi:hypothetical protein